MEGGWQVASVDHIEKSVSVVGNLDFSKCHGLGRQFHFVPGSLALANDLKFVACVTGHFEFGEGRNTCDLRRVGDSYFCSLAWGEICMGMVHLDSSVLSII